MKIIDGKALAAKLQEELRVRVEGMAVKPALMVILVGDNSASQVYVRNKARAAERIGIKSETLFLPESTSEAELLNLIDKYNADEQWHGILVQLPLPAQIDEDKVLLAIDPNKDVDGFHPMNMGRLWTGQPVMVPSTPAGVMEMFKAYDISLEGKQAVVLGRSNIVGKPMAQLMMDQNATVTLCHSRTQGLKAICQKADIIVSAIGQAEFVKADFVKEGAVVIDVGMNRNAEGKLCGDVAFDEVAEKASLITPVPGGVGPMTITMLMKQTVTACERLTAGFDNERVDK
ncbi:bifunctional methylenetetrahydrofolate dehydrogenase/methenyltetrahydrofolate cyclohydrolase [Lactococcus termiticola]|uniref:Bifunctional protein FolD n=1 Tax=Lactococcus termiticola TaxID=2169526 RepID=A0A2R5HK45_9LACT|nr:bifunctional methylenetetrahydrofolate dehydrogenase/methenyltetrahydrofolate cyclohydrolase [Lactococcus termiticola]GBG97130.1 bifunctional 5,10-methylene-tetrahydrofolate dehydrogenase / 5,10-methylene-tetrahydrofolate cyclohydrolase [Lactococcus termiticola]